MREPDIEAGDGDGAHDPVEGAPGEAGLYPSVWVSEGAMKPYLPTFESRFGRSFKVVTLEEWVWGTSNPHGAGEGYRRSLVPYGDPPSEQAVAQLNRGRRPVGLGDYEGRPSAGLKFVRSEPLDEVLAEARDTWARAHARWSVSGVSGLMALGDEVKRAVGHVDRSIQEKEDSILTRIQGVERELAVAPSVEADGGAPWRGAYERLKDEAIGQWLDEHPYEGRGPVEERDVLEWAWGKWREENDAARWELARVREAEKDLEEMIASRNRMEFRSYVVESAIYQHTVSAWDEMPEWAGPPVAPLEEAPASVSAAPLEEAPVSVSNEEISRHLLLHHRKRAHQYLVGVKMIFDREGYEISREELDGHIRAVFPIVTLDAVYKGLGRAVRSVREETGKKLDFRRNVVGEVQLAVAQAVEALQEREDDPLVLHEVD